VRGEKHAAADLIVQILGNGPSQTHAVVGAGAAADLIEDHQATVGGVVEDVGGFGNLDHESAAAPGQLVAGADAREDAVNNADPRLAGRHEAADVNHQSQQRHLADVSALAGHIRPSDEPEHAF